MPAWPAVASVLASVTVWVQDIDRDRGYTTTAGAAQSSREQAGVS
ncbi:MAG: hypothetical protein WDO18_18890 [Acidobacteriota bacterium]